MCGGFVQMRQAQPPGLGVTRPEIFFLQPGQQRIQRALAGLSFAGAREAGRLRRTARGKVPHRRLQQVAVHGGEPHAGTWLAENPARMHRAQAKGRA